MLIVGFGCLLIVGAQFWLAFRTWQTKDIADPVERLARMKQVERASRSLQVVGLVIVGASLLVSMFFGVR